MSRVWRPTPIVVLLSGLGQDDSGLPDWQTAPAIPAPPTDLFGGANASPVLSNLPVPTIPAPPTFSVSTPVFPSLTTAAQVPALPQPLSSSSRSVDIEVDILPILLGGTAIVLLLGIIVPFDVKVKKRRK